MKKIIYLNTDVKIGEMIMYEGLEIEVTQKLISDNPSIFETIVKDTPMYFKCTLNSLGFTLGRVYEQICHDCYPNLIFIQDDDSNKRRVYNWQEVRKGVNNYGFELTTKTEWDKQELLDEAKRRYPIGTVYRHFNSEYTINSPDMLTVSEMDHHFDGLTRFGTSIWVSSGEYTGVVYTDGRWAEILPLKFTTEDGVDIYGDMKTYLANPNDNSNITSCHGIWNGNSKAKCDKYFYHKENALAYIKKHKEKTLEDYENMLLRTNINSINAREVCWFYNTLKGKEPKLYYTKILQLIADDLNDGWVADFTNYDEKWCISIEDIVHYMNLQIHGIVYFKEYELAEKARDILGDKVKYLFN